MKNKQTNKHNQQQKQTKTPALIRIFLPLAPVILEMFWGQATEHTIKQLERTRIYTPQTLKLCYRKNRLAVYLLNHRLTQTTHAWCLRGNLDGLGSLGTTLTWRPG